MGFCFHRAREKNHRRRENLAEGQERGKREWKTKGERIKHQDGKYSQYVHSFNHYFLGVTFNLLLPFLSLHTGQ